MISQLCISLGTQLRDRIPLPKVFQIVAQTTGTQGLSGAFRSGPNKFVYVIKVA